MSNMLRFSTIVLLGAGGLFTAESAGTRGSASGSGAGSRYRSTPSTSGGHTSQGRSGDVESDQSPLGSPAGTPPTDWLNRFILPI